MTGKKTYLLTSDYIPLDPGGVDFSIDENFAILNRRLQEIFETVSNNMQSRGLTGSEWTVVSHDITNLGSGIMISVLTAVPAGR